MAKHQRFSIRKYKIGAVSVLLGTVFLVAAGGRVAADETTSQVDNTAIFVKADNTAAETIAETTTGSEVDSISSQTEAPVAPTTLVTDVATEATSDVTENVPISGAVAPIEDTPETQATSQNTPTIPKSQEVANDAPSEHLQAEVETKAVSENGEQTGVANKSDQPSSIDSDKIITADKTWVAGYKGEGTVVAVIDSGLDIDHDALRITNIDAAKYKDANQMEAAKKAAGISYGKWYNEKVIFAYNYVDVNDDIKEADKHSHGMHVTGIATGNPSRPDSGEFVYGVAPEAQVMFMRVFSDVKNTTGPAIYVRAIKDAVKLGADSINLSLGSAAGSVINSEESLIAAIEEARKAGVTVVMAAGNDGTWGSGQSNPLAENPDYGLVGTPSTTRDAISVASYNSTSIMSKVVQIVGMEDNEALNYGKSSFSNPELSKKIFEKGRQYDYVYLGTGKADEIGDQDLTGKIALIKRGEITFSEKVANAAAKGAEGVVIFNHTAGEENISMQLDETAISIPSIFIPFEFGNELAAHPQKYKIQFNGESDKSVHPHTNELSDFSSWGLSADGELKPDLAAPGGGIYSSINDGEYASMNGTSMASPHVAGAAALVKQYLKANFPTKSNDEIEALVKHLLMSTAKAHFNTETQAYTSPRQQGAGIVDTQAATTKELYLTGSDDYSSITLGNVKDSFSFDVTIHNIGNKDQRLKYLTNLNTDGVENGKFTLKPRSLATIDGNDITVKANSTATVTITVDASTFAKELQEQMPNGYYLEGFVRFVDSVDGVDVVSIPYVGFRGNFQDLAVTEKAIYSLVADGKGGFYYQVKDNVVATNADVTALITTSSEPVYSATSTISNTPGTYKVLGTFANDSGQYILKLDDGKAHLAISPNGDGNQELLAFRGVFLRNFSDLSASVYAADDQELANPLWESQSSGGEKNFYSGNPDHPKSSLMSNTYWVGTDNKGQDLPDGHYKYVLRYLPDVPGAKVQETIFDVLIDRQAPVVTTATFNADTLNFNPRDAVDKGDSGIFRERVFYLVTDENGNQSKFDINDNTGKIQLVDDKVYVEQAADGSFTLPLDKAAIGNFYYTVEDYAGNITSVKISDLITIGNKNGLVRVNARDIATDDETGIDFSYSVKDAKGQIISEVPRYAGNNDILILPFGTYTIEMFLYDTDRAVLVGETKKTITISETNSLENVSFYVNTLQRANLLIDFDKTLPKDTVVGIVSENGKTYQLPEARYSESDYGKVVYVGKYKLLLNLPDGYELLEDPTFSVVAGRPNKVNFTVIDKTGLKAEEEQASAVVDSALYYNASPDRVAAYDKALADAQSILVAKRKQIDVDAALKDLTDARAALNGKPTDFSVLTNESQAYDMILTTPAYYNADPDKQVAYDTVRRATQLVLANPKASQAEVNDVTDDLLKAHQALNGQVTALTALQAELAKHDDLLSSPTYYNAQPDFQKAYRTAYAVAQEVLKKADAHQLEVDQALKTLQVARANLDGKLTVIKENLLSALLDAQKADIRNKTPESLEALKVAIDTATVVRFKEDASQDEVDAATQALEKAIASLVNLITKVPAVAPTADEKPEAVITERDIAYTSRIVEDPNLPEGTRQVLIKGHNGLRRLVSVNGKVMIDEVVTEVVEELILVGTKKEPVPTQSEQVNKSGLYKLVSQSDEFKRTSASYQNASTSSKSAYNQALRVAQAILADANTNQIQIDEVLANLEEAKASLDGQTNFGEQNIVNQPVTLTPKPRVEQTQASPIKERANDTLPTTGDQSTPILISLLGIMLTFFSFSEIRKRQH